MSAATNDPGTHIYDFTDADWTTPRLESEFKLVVRFINEDALKIGDRTPTADELRINRNYGARWKEINAELDRRGHGKARARPSPARKSGRPRRSAKRLAPLGPYAPVPRAILKDAKLSISAKGFAAVIADSINLGPWNTDLHAKLTYGELAEKTGISLRSAARAVAELKAAGYIKVESLNRGGCKITFTT